MGVEISRQFSDEVAACINKGVGVENLLLNQEFVTRFKIFCEALPVEARHIIQNLGRRHAPGERGKSYLSKIQQVKASDVGISEGFAPFFESWTEPEAFFNPCKRLSAGSIVSQVYEELRHISKRNVDDPIRLRIYAVALCDLRDLVDENYQSLLRPGIKELIAQIIFDSSIVHDSLKEVVRWVELYVKFGQRMKMIADRNGGLGALLVIPSSLLSLRQWTKELNSADFDQALEHFDMIEVAQKASETGSHDVASRIHSVMMQKFTSSIYEGPVSTPQHVRLANQDGAPSDKNSTDDQDEDMLEGDGSSDDSLLNNSDATSSRTSPGVLVRDGMESASVQTQLQGWKPSRNDETLPNIEQDGQQVVGGYSSTSTFQAFPTMLAETTVDSVGTERSQHGGTLNQDGSSQNTSFQELQTPQPFQNPYFQQSENLQTPQPLQNPYLRQPESFQTSQPFQNPYIQQNESFQAAQLFQNPETFQAPQPFQNPYILQPESFQAQQSFQQSNAPQSETLQMSQPLQGASNAPDNGTQVLQEHQNAHCTPGGQCNPLLSPREAIIICNRDQIVVDAYG